MEDFSNWWYIIAAVIYFLTRSKKKKTKSQPVPTHNEKSNEQQEKPESFEDLLRKITGNQVDDEKEEVREEATSDQNTESTQPFIPTTHSTHVNSSVPNTSPKVKTTEIKRTTKNLDESSHVFQPTNETKKFTEKAFAASEIKDGLKNIKEIKKAIIYSEILKRKY